MTPSPLNGVLERTRGSRSPRLRPLRLLPLLLLIVAAVVALPTRGSAHDIELVFEVAISPDPDDATAPLPVERVELGAQRPVNPFGGDGDRNVGNPVFEQLTVTRVVDFTAPALFRQAARGVSLGTATLRVYEPDPLNPGERRLIEEYTLSEALVSSWSIDADAGFGLLETFTLSFTRIGWCPFFYDETGEQSAGECFGWDVAFNEPWTP